MDEGVLTCTLTGRCSVEQCVKALEASRAAAKGLAKFEALSLVSSLQVGVNVLLQQAALLCHHMMHAGCGAASAAGLLVWCIVHDPLPAGLACQVACRVSGQALNGLVGAGSTVKLARLGWLPTWPVSHPLQHFHWFDADGAQRG